MFQGARNTKFVLAPGSVLTRRPPRWVVVADLVETSRLYGRTAARIEPETIEHVAEHLLQRTYSEPHWDAKRGAVMAYERVTLYGLPIVTRRRIGYAADRSRNRPRTVHPACTRRRRLGDPTPLLPRQRATACRAGRARGARAASRPARRRRRDLRLLRCADPRRRRVGAPFRRLVEEAAPTHAGSAHLHPRRPDARRGRRRPAGRWRSGDLTLPLTYRFEPGAPDDGVTVHVPVDVLARLGGDEFAWQVPALREELLTALIRSLPKDLRRNFVPAPDTARALLGAIAPDDSGSLLDAVQRELRRWTGVLVPVDAFDLDKLPPHLRVTFAVEAGDGTEVARARASANCRTNSRRRRGRPSPPRSPADSSAPGCATGPRISTNCRASSKAAGVGHTVRGYPALRRRGRDRGHPGVRHNGRAGRGDAPPAPVGCCGWRDRRP